MNNDRKMEVADWQNSPAPTIPKAPIRRRSLPPMYLGIIGTLLLHAVFIESVSFGSHTSNPKPQETQESTHARSKSSDTENLVLIALPMTTTASETKSQNWGASLPELSKMKIKLPIDAGPPQMQDLEILALSEDQLSNQSTAGAEGGEQARLFGIYTGQIQARIDRVWRRPRSPVNEEGQPTDASDSFQCEAQIVQDAKGNVQEILLPRCNGSPAWQHSLVVAIQQASPLPAPPSEKVFRKSIILNFNGLQYFAGASDDEYQWKGQALTGNR